MSVFEVSVDYGGRQLTLQTGKLAKQADASVLVKYGETHVLVTVCASQDLKEGQDFFPLTVDYQEKYYAAGRIPGGFFKREAKPSEKATLSARLIDRPIRPLFPEDFLCETNVVATVLSSDGVNEADLCASIGTSAALHISDVPWSGPIGTCRVGRINGEFVVNPPPAEQPNSELELLVSGVRTGVIMVEGSAKEVPEQTMMDAIDFAHQNMMPVIDMIEELRSKAGKQKRDYAKPPKDEAFKKQLREELWPSFEKAFAIREKLARYEALSELKKSAKEKYIVEAPETDAQRVRNELVGTYVEELKASYAREKTLYSKTRIDGRSYTDIRPISCEVGLLPRVHGSGLFTRGETQVLAAITLGTADDEQKIDSVSGVFQKTFMLHYNFPPFSVGEARPLRPPGRREIGHGFLAERALQFIIPPKEAFPYTIRLVSEVLESNGSSSMATVCSGSLALMDAGVPVPKPVAGVAMGLIKENEAVAVISDILGDEDHLGDMDFKVCGTADGITAFQMDLKIGGVSRDIMERALSQARDGRLHILAKMNEVMDKPRDTVSPYAPRIFTMKVRPEKVREVIGSGGKVIRSIIDRTGVKIDIEDDGSINIASADEVSAQKAISIINQIVEEPEVGKIYEGKVTRIADFGAFVEIIPGTDGLCHISELDHHRVRRVEDVVKEGEVIRVKCLDVDSQGKIRLSRKAILPKEGSPQGESRDGGPAVSEPRPDVAGVEEEDRGNRFERPQRLDRDRGGERDRDRDRDRPERGERGSRFEHRERDRGERDRGDRDRGRDHRDVRDRGRGGERSFDRPPRDRQFGRGGEERDERSHREERPPREERPHRGERGGNRGDDRGNRFDRPRGGERDRGDRDRDRSQRFERDDRDRDFRYDRDERFHRDED